MASDWAPLPAELTARILKLMGEPLFRPVNVCMVVLASLLEMVVQLPLPCLYSQLVMVLLLGLSHWRVTELSPGWASRPVGLAGTPRTGVAVTSEEATPPPVALTARSWKVYCVSLVRPVTA